MCAQLSEDSDQLGHSVSLIRILAVRMKLAETLSVQRRLGSDCAAAQSGLSLCWAQGHVACALSEHSDQRGHQPSLIRDLVVRMKLAETHSNL